ncbi:glycosyl-4,4'-diaponeurosporenoate acyltransferase [Limisphaera ngatamarikiensis]|uniref:Glycosyl-4,4'-diaponeurosporenoate acyltransferase n=1 Tax=Limisphaera ngatamarikiensis TaxID=1324935 RepID=A0A6M1RU96_9BACT|nr:glycosyl-4,4'-diaponeurosporenoate acyltransferase [Limisphaera ngatamarikiensis]NGO38964.1 glycosyl-4,4'-diaponeurosporenoate acyltransferase [Limisphaera ngatamarikiensis]
MLTELPTWLTALLNVIGWPVIQLGWAWIFTRLPSRWFHPPRGFAWEAQGRLYERLFAVRRWKDRLPDGAAWFRHGFPKSALRSSQTDYLRAFLVETWRGELCHWAALASTPVFALWNPPWAILIMTLCGLLLNIPCILAQRYNRIRLRRLVEKRVTTSS